MPPVKPRQKETFRRPEAPKSAARGAENPNPKIAEPASSSAPNAQNAQNYAKVPKSAAAAAPRSSAAPNSHRSASAHAASGNMPGNMPGNIPPSSSEPLRPLRRSRTSVANKVRHSVPSMYSSAPPFADDVRARRTNE
eukprot:9490646-Pyramimonas_sp.AAC.1